ncbi:E3 ubiquitin ligase BIG BROTHER-related [Platanthera guangdongensis]|uniref:RING-type E3 ubiquitin transferase n=1 Tax=Platanthera guangdongensis TaxID=2320717 RepID=A0ABR2M238_9ASPA
MASADGPLASPDRRGLRRLLRLRNPSASSSQDQNLLISSSSLPPPPASSSGGKKKAFASAAFRSLGCSSSSAAQVYAPSSSAAAAVRSSADWEGKLPRRRRSKQSKKERRAHLSSSVSADVWCAPGISFVGDDSVDCVVSHREMVGRGGRIDVERTPRERPYYGRRGGSQEQVSSMSDSLFSRLYYHYAPFELEEAETARSSSSSYFGHDLPATIMLLHHRILLHGGDPYDRYRDWRLDVDQMTYEELLELGEKIGHVSTGLREDEIECCIRKVKHSIFDKCFSTEMERKCSICQEEYETEDEAGKLGCGHSYHMYCIRRWLLQKNACPVCKTAVSEA